MLGRFDFRNHAADRLYPAVQADFPVMATVWSIGTL